MFGIDFIELIFLVIVIFMALDPEQIIKLSNNMVKWFFQLKRQISNIEKEISDAIKKESNHDEHKD